MARQARCKKCGKPLNPVEVLFGKICGKCARKAHKQAVGK